MSYESSRGSLSCVKLGSLSTAGLGGEGMGVAEEGASEDTCSQKFENYDIIALKGEKIPQKFPV